MLNKSFLINRVVNCLSKKEYRVLVTQGCFDIAARNEFMLLIKALINVDGLKREQALSLKAISHFISAHPFIISLKNNREFLVNNVIYSRFELPVVTPNTFENIIEEEMVCIKSAKGRYTVEIDPLKLRKKRKELNLTLEELSSRVGISKKALYEIENKRVNPTLETVKNLEIALGIRLKSPYEFESIKPVYLKAKDEFQNRVSRELLRIGFDNSSVYSAPFEIIGREKSPLIAGLSKNTTKIKKEAGKVKNLSSIFFSQCIFVAKKCREKNIEGVPIFLESELSEFDSAKEFRKVIGERAT